jgi:HSP20 family protein
MLPTTRRNVRNIWADPFDSLHREFDRALSRMVSDQENGGPATAHYPVDIHEDEDNITVEAEMPGFSKDEIDVTLENGVLTIQAERKVAESKGSRHLNERRFTRVARSFSLPNSVDESDVDASLTDGVLTLTLKKREEVKPRRIEVK